jgi:tRNA threonylcarbamoyladenosine biosynthesis protein TsaB
MAKILCIETSTSVCSVAFAEGGKTMVKKELFQGNSHSSHLNVLIESLFESTGTPDMSELDAVAVSSGPGSYTGLRIGVSAAKGICYALDIPLIAIPSLKILAQAALLLPRLEQADTFLYCPMIDARRMEVYCAIYDHRLNVVEETSAEIIDESSFVDLLNHQKVIFMGDGAEKCKTTIVHENAVFVEGMVPLAADMAQLAEEAFNQNGFEDVAYFEPFYLKDFVATKSKKKWL